MARRGGSRVTRHHPDWLAAYVATLTPKGEAPERFHFWTGVSAIAGVLRRRVYVDEGHYRHYPNFYIILVGPPGLVKKSTTINVGVGLLREVPNVILGADCSTWQSFVEEVAEAKDIFAEGDDQHVELDSLLDQTHTVTSAITLAISEFGTFFDPEDRAMVNVLTELYDGKVNSAFTKRTKTQGTDTIMNPFVNIIAGTTPDWMRDNFRGRFGGWGLSSRIIFLHCDEKERSVAFPHKLWAGTYERTMETFTADLIEISKLQGTYTFSPDAEALYEELYDAHGRRQTALNRHPHHDPWLSYYLARKLDHVIKLAIVLAASRRSELLITLSDMRDSVARCDEIEHELGKVFQSRQSDNRDVRLNMDVWRGLEEAIKRHGRIKQVEAFSFMVQWMDYGKGKQLLDQLIASHWLLAESEPGGVFYSFGENAQLSESKPNGQAS
jgi:hypothetical protein